MKHIYFDIETRGLRDKAIQQAKPFKEFVPLPPFDPSAVKIGNLKNQEKIAEKIKEAEENYPKICKEYEEDYETSKAIYEAGIIAKSALSAFSGEVVAIGLYFDNKFQILSGLEEEILRDFWEFYKTNTQSFVGFNITNFDVPFLVRRSWAKSVPVPSDVLNGKFISNRFVDLMSIAAVGEYGFKVSLNNLCRLLEIEGKSEDLTGAEFAEYFLSDDIAKVELAKKYLERDVKVLEDISKRLFCEETLVENPFYD